MTHDERVPWHKNDPGIQLEYALEEINFLRAENERLRELHRQDTLRLMDENDRLQAENEHLRRAAQAALNELGVPTENYPAPIANAVAILRDGLA